MYKWWLFLVSGLLCSSYVGAAGVGAFSDAASSVVRPANLLSLPDQVLLLIIGYEAHLLQGDGVPFIKAYHQLTRWALLNRFFKCKIITPDLLLTCMHNAGYAIQTLSLHQLVKKNAHHQFITAAIKAGLNVNGCDVVGKTPAHYATNKKIMWALSEAGANFALTDHDGRTPWHYIQDPQAIIVFEGVIDVRARDASGRTPLHYATNKKIIESWWALNAPVNAIDNYGLTPLHLACLSNYGVAVVKALIRSGAAVNALSHARNTPLHYTSDPAVVAVLLAAGADPSIQGFGGRLPLHVCRNPVSIRHLIERCPAAVVAPDSKGCIPLNSPVVRQIYNQLHPTVLMRLVQACAHSVGAAAVLAAAVIGYNTNLRAWRIH